jgi:hypothetical protein
MSRSLGVLTLDLITKTSGFVEGLTKAERASAKSKKQFEKDLNSLKRNVKLAGAAFAAGATAMIASSIKLADESRKTAQAVGLTTEALTGFRFAAQQSGVSNEELTTSFRQFARSINDASNGIGKGKESFDALGISVTDANGNLKDSETLFFETANRLAEMDDGLQKTAFASDLLGRSGSKLIPLLNGGEEGIKKLTDQAKKLGLVISEDTAKNAELFNDSLSILTSSFRGTANVIVANFIPAFAEMASIMAEAELKSNSAQRSGDAFTEVLKAVGQVAIGAAGYIDTYAKGLAGLVFIASQVPKGFDAVKDAVSLVGDELDKNIKKYDEYLKTLELVGTKTEEAGGERPNARGAGAAFGSELDKELGREKELESLEESFQTEYELLQEKHRQENELLAEAREQKLETTRSYDELEMMLAERQAKQLSDIEKASYQERLKLTQGALSNLSTLMNSESRKAFEVGKAAALANAIVSGADSAVLAYEGGLKVSGGNPAVGAAFAATAIAATAVQIQAIRSAKFGGGGGGAGSGSSNTQAVNNASEGVQPPGGGQESSRNVFVRGINKGDLYSGEQLLDLINNELSNGGKIIASG